jgi:amidase
VGVHPLSPSLDHVGFFARRVDDVAFALSLLGGSSDTDRHGQPVPSFHVATDTGLDPLKAPRLAVVRFEKWSRAEPEQQQVFNAAVGKLRDAGAIVHEADFAKLDQTAWETINTILICEATAIFAELVERFPDRTSDRLKEFVATGRTRSAYDYLVARKQQERLRTDFAAQMSGFDAVLTLPAFGEAPRGLSYTGDADYCAPWTLLGAPALSLPAGFGKNHLPLGVQVVGAYREDLKTLRIAKWVEQALACDLGIPDMASR